MKSQGVSLLVRILLNGHDLLDQRVVEIRCSFILPHFCIYFNHQTDISHGQSTHQLRQVPAGEPGLLTQQSDMWCHLWKPRGQIVMTPSGKGTNTINSVKGDLWSFWTLRFGLFINLFSIPASEWKADKVQPGQITPKDLLTGDPGRPTAYQSIRKNLVIHLGSSLWEKLE